MGQIVRRKRRGRPSNTDRARINYSATPPSPVDRRRSRRRRNVRYNFDIDDYVDDDEFYSDEDEEVGRREKKLRLLLCEDDSRPNTRRVRHAPTSSSSDDYYEEDDVKHSKKRKIDAGGREDDEDNEVEEIRGRKLEEEDDEEEEEQEEQEQQVEEEEDEEEEEEALGGSASEFSKDVPLPDKKTLEFILEKLQKKDTYGVYSEPVDPDELPDYHDVIKHPMDFSTVRKKLAKGSYLTLKQFESDVFLICTNAMQYNAPDTIYYKQASSIQEQAKLRFQRLRANVDRSETEQINTDHRIPPSFSFSPPKKQLKKPVGRPVVHDPIGSETLSGANVRIEEFTNGSSVKTPVRLNSSEAINAENYFVPDESLDKEQELVTGKGSVSKLGTKPVHDENRRATYNTCVENSVAESDSIFTIFEGESKQFIPVGLHADHSYARSLSRFASSLGSVAWKVASETIEQSLPAGVKYGRGWVGEYEPLPTTVTIMPGDYTLKEASRRNSNSLLTTLEHNLMKPLKNESVRSEQQPIKDPKNPFFNFSSEGPTPHVDIITRKPDIIASPRPSVNHLNIQNDGFAPQRPSQGNARKERHPVQMMPSFNQPNMQNDGFTPGRPSQGNATKVSGPVQRMPSFNQPNIQNDGFTPRRPSQGNTTLVGKEQPPPPGMIPSFRYPNGQNDGFAPGRPSQGNATLVGREQQRPGMIPAFCHPNGQNDGFAPGRPSQGNATFVGREQQQPPGMIPSFRHPNDGFTPGRPSQGNLTPLSREQPPFNHPNSQNDGFAPSKLASEPGLSDPVQMMKMLAERTHNQSQSQQNSLKREESGAQAWMSLGGTHKQPIVPPPPVVDSLNNNNNNNTRYQPQATRFRGEVQFQGDKNSYQQQPQHFPQLVTADLSRFQVQPSWRGVTPQMQQQFRPKQQESCPPDLNIGYQSSPVRQSTGMMVDSQQPDLALQL